MAPPYEQTLLTPTQGLFVCNLRILLQSFDGEDFQMFPLNLL